jgi:REP element-mobilizing transposase RayT
MPNFKRAYVPGGTFFFTVVTHHRTPLFQQENAQRLLGTVIRKTQQEWPFKINAIVLLPDHIQFNPVKHGYVNSATDWKASSIHRWIKAGVYPQDCGGSNHQPFDFSAIEDQCGEPI